MTLPTTPTATTAAALASLADYLAARRDAILAAWATAARSDPGLTTPATLSRSQFYDHIPHMLDALEQKLLAVGLRAALEARQDEVDNAEGHGLQRWQQGYAEREVMREWISLNDCLANELQAYSAANPVADSAALSFAWRMLSEFAISGMSESVAQYSRLQRTEATGRLRSLEEALARLNELEQQRAALWREATHDLRGNLGVVRNVAQVLQHAGPRDDRATQALDMLDRGVGALHALLDDLTIQARLDAGQEHRQIGAFDVAVALTELCRSGRLSAEGRGLRFEMAGPEELLVEGDEVKTRRIAQNLLQNALAYTVEGGVEVSWTEVDEPPRRWVMCVKDTGPGLGTLATAPLAVAIEAATRDTQELCAAAVARGEEQAVRPAATTLRSGGRMSAHVHGEGVGLSIVKRLCELLDASLELQTEAGKGTTFRVTFPMRYPKG